MKSSFLLLVILSSLVSAAAWGQASTTADPNKSAFDKFYERLSIGYSGTISTPTLGDWDSRYAALAPGFMKEFGLEPDTKHNGDTYPLNLYNAVNFGYNYGGTLKFNIIPRWTTFLAEAPAQDAGQRGTFLMEDWFVGFSGTIFTSADKKFSWWIRPGARLPTSIASKNSVHPQYGTLSHQPEVSNVFGYTLNPTWSVDLFYQARFWVYEDRYNYARMRNLVIPSIYYQMNDATKLFASYELMSQNNRNWQSIDDQDPKFIDLWQNAKAGVSYDINAKLNITPYFNVYVDDVPLSMESAWIGIDLAYQIK